jgi:DNA-binding XRE family transcriptional regulator
MKNSVSLEKILAKELKTKELCIAFDEQRFYLQIAHLISELRAKCEISQAELAKRAKVTQPQVARLEKGDSKRKPTFNTIYKILKALGYEMSIQIQPQRKRAA